MKIAFLSFAFLGMAILCHAQKNSKNEFSFGYFGAGEFFDTSTFRFSDFGRGKNFSLQYTRTFGKRLTVGLAYSHNVFYYLRRFHGKLENNTIMWREQKTLSADAGIGVSKWSMRARAKTGICYNLTGYKHEFYYSATHTGGWREAIVGNQYYGKWGARLGACIQHPIIWRFFGELGCEYARMFSGKDRNQLLLSYRIGIKF